VNRWLSAQLAAVGAHDRNLNEREKEGLTENRHVIVHLHDDPSGQELTREEEEVGVVEQDQELDQLPRHVRHFCAKSSLR